MQFVKHRKIYYFEKTCKLIIVKGMTIALIIPLINFTKKSSYPQDIFDFSYFIELITSFASTTKN